MRFLMRWPPGSGRPARRSSPVAGVLGVELAGLEPATSWVRSRRSPKLSYSPGTAKYRHAKRHTERPAICTTLARSGRICNATGVMGTLDDAIREHLELKRRLGASEEELQEKETEAFGPPGPLPRAEPPAAEEEPEFQVQRTGAAEAPEPAELERDPWEPAGSDDDLFERDEVLPQDALEPNGAYAPPPAEPETGAEEPHEDPLDEWEGEP